MVQKLKSIFFRLLTAATYRASGWASSFIAVREDVVLSERLIVILMAQLHLLPGRKHNTFYFYYFKHQNVLTEKEFLWFTFHCLIFNQTVSSNGFLCVENAHDWSVS